MPRISWKATSVFRRMKKKPSKPGRRAALLLTILLLTACQPSVIPQAQATPRILVVAVTPALQPLNSVFQDCAAAQGNTGLVAVDTPAQALDLNKTPLALRWGAPASASDYAAVLGEEEFVVVVNPQNPLQQITLAELKAIYTGAQRAWKGPSTPAEVHPWALPGGDDVEAIFDAAILDAPAAPRVTFTAPDPAAMRASIAKDAAAIGFLPRRWLDTTVKFLPIAGIDPARLHQPILATSKSEPGGLEKSWLICIQERLKG